MRKEEVANLAKFLLDCDTDTKYIFQDIIVNILSSYLQCK